MSKLVIGAVAAVGLALGMAPGQASAAYLVPAVPVVPAVPGPAPVVVTPVVHRAPYWRSYRYHHVRRPHARAHRAYFHGAHRAHFHRR
jgi:hypothetical protein